MFKHQGTTIHLGIECQILTFLGGKNPMEKSFAKPFIKSQSQCYGLEKESVISQDNATAMNKLPNPKLKTTKGSFFLMPHVHWGGCWGSSSLQDVGSQNAIIWSLEFLVTKRSSKCSHMFASRTSTWMAFKGERSIIPKGRGFKYWCSEMQWLQAVW